MANGDLHQLGWQGGTKEVINPSKTTAKKSWPPPPLLYSQCYIPSTVLVGSLKMNTALEYSTRVVQEGYWVH